MKWFIRFFLFLSLDVALVSSTFSPFLAQDQGSSAGNQQSDSLDSSESGPKNNQPSEIALPTHVTSSDYFIGPEDVLTIEVFGLPEMRQMVRVENDGTISVRLLGPVRAAGLTPLQLKHELETDWGKQYLQDPQVSVFVKTFHARPVSVVGEVAKPGLYQLPGPRSLVQVLAMAGGLVRSTSTGPGAGRYLFVTRKSGFDKLEPMAGGDLVAPDKLKVDIRKLLFSSGDGPNLQIEPKDQITVPHAGVVYIVGDGVMHPQKVILEDQDSMTVLQALAVAQGLTPNAGKSHAKIIRQTSSGATTEIPLNLGKIFKGKSPDPKLAANDMLFVPVSRGKAVAKGGISAAIGTLSGYLIFHP